MQHWDNYKIEVRADDERAKLQPGDFLKPRLLQLFKEPRPSLWSRVRGWFSAKVSIYFARRMRRRQDRIEAKVRDGMIEKTTNAWKSDADE